MPARLTTGLIVALGALGAAAPAATAESPALIRGYDDPATPAGHERINVMRFGPQSARRVLVLVPGAHAGAGSFTLAARELVRRVRGLQVWAFDRRGDRLEDRAGFAPATAPSESLDYYGGERFRAVDGASDTPYARGWGLRVTLEDLRCVVRAARRGGRRVTLGGHGLGAAVAAAYAAWDFGGRPGHRDVHGLVLIDGGPLGASGGAGLLEARRRKATIDRGEPFAALVPGRPPWAAGVIAELAARFTRVDPRSRSPLQDHALLPPAFRPPVPVTNAALLGHAFDRETAPRAFATLRVRAGRLAAAGDPRPWTDRGGLVPVQSLARTFSQFPVDASEWYFPRRLALDVEAASTLRTTRAGLLLRLRLRHLATMDEPIYAYQAAPSRGRVLRAARTLFRATRARRAVYADDDGAMPYDPLLARPTRNYFLRTVVPFLRGLD